MLQKKQKRCASFRNTSFLFQVILNFVCKVVNKVLGLFPAKAGVCDGFSVDSAVGFLTAVLDIAFDHKAFYHFCDVAVISAAIHNFMGNTDLFKPLFSGV